MTTSTNIKSVKVQNFKIELTRNQKGAPSVTVWKVLQSGPNKGQLKHVEGFYFLSEASRVEWITKRVDAINKHVSNKIEAKKRAEVTVNPYLVGSILYDSWGYDQTNIDFYQIVEVTKKAVKVRKISGEVVSQDKGDSGRVKPSFDQFIGDDVVLKMIRARVSKDGVVFNVVGLSDYTRGEEGVYYSWGR